MARKTSFYYSFLVLPAAQRRAIVAVWDFCRAVDDAVDECAAPAGHDGQNGDRRITPESSRAVGRVAIASWRAELSRCFSGDVPETSQGKALQPFITEFDLPRQAFADVIDGVAMDLDKARYETFDELLEYCRRVASAVGMICIRIFGCRHEGSRDYALYLGVALQLTNILRDVKADFDLGRVYLPLEDLAATGCSVEHLAAGRMSEPVRRVMELEDQRARNFYRLAVEARPAEDRGRLVAAEVMRAVYFETLRRIEQRGYDVFSGRTRVPKPQQALIALKQWLLPS